MQPFWSRTAGSDGGGPCGAPLTEMTTFASSPLGLATMVCSCAGLACLAAHSLVIGISAISGGLPLNITLPRIATGDAAAGAADVDCATAGRVVVSAAGNVAGLI